MLYLEYHVMQYWNPNNATTPPVQLVEVVYIYSDVYLTNSSLCVLCRSTHPSGFALGIHASLLHTNLKSWLILIYIISDPDCHHCIHDIMVTLLTLLLSA